MQKIPPIVEKVVFYGILFSLSLVFGGGLLFLKKNAWQSAQLPMPADQFVFKITVQEIMMAAINLSPMGIIQLGLLSLAVVQILRVIFIAGFFLKMKDYLFTFMCCFILGVLIYGLL